MSKLESSPLPRRQANKAARRGEIVASAAALWRERGLERVSLHEIAERAGVVPQTLYNLVGGAEPLMFAVIEALLDELDVELSSIRDQGVERSLRCVRVSAAMFARDPALYRQLIVRLPQAIFAGASVVRDSAQIQVRAVAEAQDAGELLGEVDAERLGQHIFTGYMGALYAWGCGGLDADGFALEAELAALGPLTALATERARPALLEGLTRLLGDKAAARRARA